VFRVDGSGATHEISPPHGCDLTDLEAFVTDTEPPSMVEALRIREAISLAVSRDAGTSVAPEMTAHLRNEPGPKPAHSVIP
jgi:hypothetical protein